MDNLGNEDKLKTIRAHRRVASNPFPIFTAQPDSSGGESDTDLESISTAPPDTRMSISDDTPFDPMMSMMSSSNSGTITLEIADLCHSPTLNRRSVSIFNFCEADLVSSTGDNISEGIDSPDCESLEMAAALLNKIHRSFTNLTSASSIESIEREDYRDMVLREILDTEQTYLSSLDTLLSVFLPALEELVAPRDLRLLFPCQLEPLLEIHQNLLTNLEQRIDGTSNQRGIVGDLFEELCSDKEKEFIPVYSAYMNEFKVAMQTLVKYQNTSPLFCRTANNCIKHQNFDGLNLSSFLLTPIQRLPRYELLLKQLMKHTPEGHQDVSNLQSAIKALHSDLTMLDRSIQACQFASTVSNMKEEAKGRRSLRKNKSRKRHQSSRFAARIKRHFSHASINDFDQEDTSSRRRRPASALQKSSSLAISDYNILDKVGNCDDRHKSVTSVSLIPSRAISCSEVHLLDPDKQLEDLGSLIKKEDDKCDEEDERTPCMSHSSSINSQDSIIVTLNNRGSVYSTNSSTTSGFDSLTGMMVETDSDTKHNYNLEISSTLRPAVHTLTSTCSNDSGFRDGIGRSEEIPMISINDVSADHFYTQQSMFRKKKSSSFSNAFKAFKKELGGSPLTRQRSSSGSTNNLGRLEIGDPSDFRHIQHGFSTRPMSIAI